jgi:nucleotide-binding universal stress UspA family protein
LPSGDLKEFALAVSRILVAVNSPWDSERFIAPIADLAQRLSADVVAAHVAEVQKEDEHDSDAKRRGEETLKLLVDGLRQAGTTVESLMLFSDDVPKAILNTAKAQACTLIVLGLSEHGFFKNILKRLFASDVVTNITKSAEVPVLVCPTQWKGTL